MKRLLFLLAMLTPLAHAATVISPLPNNIQNGQPADAMKLMANFNQIVTNVNANAAAINATNVFTAPQQFSAALTLNEGVIASQIQNSSITWLGLAGGTANALAANAVIVPLAYQAGQRWAMQAAATNTGAVTLNISGLGPRAVTKFGGTALIAGDIVAGQIIVVEDDGTRFQMINTAIPSGIPYVDAGGTPNALTATYLLPAKNLTLVDGLDLTLGIPSPNTNNTVTFTPILNGVTAPTWNIVKFVSNVEVQLSPGDLQGDAWLKADAVNNVWVLQNPGTLAYATPVNYFAGVSQTVGSQLVPPGTIIDFAGPSCPTNYLQAPLAALAPGQVVNRTTYAALFAAIGTAWGAGDGSTTFGIPWFPANYAAVMANANVGSSTIGQMPSHVHQETTFVQPGGATQHVAGATGDDDVSPYTAALGTQGGAARNTIAAGSGTDNLAAGMRVLKCIKY